MKPHQAIIAGLLLALSIFGGTHGAMAAERSEPAGYRMCSNGFGPMTEFAGRIDKALKADPTGTKVKIEGCRATPIVILTGVLKRRPNATVNGQQLANVSQLSAYLRKLIEVKLDPAATIVSDCIWSTKNGDAIKSNCSTRRVMPDERGYRDPDDPNANAFVIISGCSNTDAVVIDEIVVTNIKCLTLKVAPVMKGIPLRTAYIGPKPLPGTCFNFQLIGEQPTTEMRQECPNSYQKTLSDGRIVTVTCDWRAVEQRVKTFLHDNRAQVQNLSQSYFTRAADGYDVYTLPAEVKDGVVALCWELPDGTILTVGVTKDDFVNGVATVTREQANTIGRIH